jgi:hypothetical protein
VQTLGRMEFLSRFKPEGFEQRSCSELYALNIPVSESQVYRLNSLDFRVSGLHASGMKIQLATVVAQLCHLGDAGG